MKGTKMPKKTYTIEALKSGFVVNGEHAFTDIYDAATWIENDLDKADEKEWIEWKGGDCPVDDEQRVEVKLRNGSLREEHAHYFIWDHWESSGDIIAYRIIKD